MQPIELNFKPSITLSLLILVFTLGACTIVIAVLDWQWKWLLALGMALYAAYVLFLQALLILPWSYIGLSINSKNEFRLHCRSGKVVAVTIATSTVVTPYLTVVHLRKNKGEGSVYDGTVSEVVILPDSVIDREAYRQLRVWLRWGTTRT